MRLRALVDQLSAMLAYWDASQRCRFANRAYEQWFGRDPETMVGGTLAELLGPLYDLNQPYVDAVLQGRSQEFEQLIPDPSGGPARHSLGQYVPDLHDGKVRGFFALVTDVSSLKRAQASLLDLERKLQATERLTALGTLAAGIAHEINNPLTCVTLNLQLALEQLEREQLDRALLLADLKEAKLGADRIASIVQSMRLLARGSPASSSDVDVNGALEKSVTLVSSSLRYRAQLERQYAEVRGVNGDASQLAQVFVNLLTNAAQAVRGREGGTICLRTRGTDATITIEVEDNGCGISEEIQPRVFDPFFTTRAAGEGMGLGLSVSAAIVKGLAGELTFSSRVDHGSVFRVVLPASQHAKLSQPAPHLTGELPRIGMQPARRVLIIDDEQPVAEVLRRILSTEAEVVVRSDALAALELIVAEGYRFSLILCDLMMPTMTGNELFLEATARDPTLKERFVFMTGGAFTTEGRRFLATVERPVLRKPFDVARVRQLVRAATAP
jgi:PAS domain S-box-containing protein